MPLHRKYCLVTLILAAITIIWTATTGLAAITLPQEKPPIIKGLYHSMPISEAADIVKKISTTHNLPRVSVNSSTRGEENFSSIVQEYSEHDFTQILASDGKVYSIQLKPQLVDKMLDSGSLTGKQLAEQLFAALRIPMPKVWRYSGKRGYYQYDSPSGWYLRVDDNKSIEMGSGLTIDVLLTDSEIAEQCQSNAAAFQRKYLVQGKRIWMLIKTTVLQIDGETATVGRPGFSIRCPIKYANPDEVDALRKGKPVVVRGELKGIVRESGFDLEFPRFFPEWPL